MAVGKVAGAEAPDTQSGRGRGELCGERKGRPPGSLGRGHEGPASCPLGKPCTCALRPEEGHGHGGSWGDWVWSGRDRTLWTKGEGTEVNSRETSRVSIVHHPGMEAKLSYLLASSGMAQNVAGGGLVTH